MAGHDRGLGKASPIGRSWLLSVGACSGLAASCVVWQVVVRLHWEWQMGHCQWSCYQPSGHLGSASSSKHTCKQIHVHY